MQSETSTCTNEQYADQAIVLEEVFKVISLTYINLADKTLIQQRVRGATQSEHEDHQKLKPLFGSQIPIIPLTASF